MKGHFQDHLSEIWPEYEPRQEQVKMSAAVEEALTEGRHLAVEAGTGVGKSLAYLLPLLKIAVEDNVRVAVSTETVSLQRQLRDKDVPLASKILGKEIITEVCLGAGNFVCKRRLGRVLAEGSIPPQDTGKLGIFQDWAEATTTGIRSDFTSTMSSGFWEKIVRDPDDCLGRRCPNYDTSYYFVARERWKRARLLIVNHSLLASHFLMENRLLPEFEYLVMDEAHRFPEIFLGAASEAYSFQDMGALARDLGPGSERLARTVEDLRVTLVNRLGLFPGQRHRLKSGLDAKEADELAEILLTKHAEISPGPEEDDPGRDNPDAEEAMRTMVLRANLLRTASFLQGLSRGPGEDFAHWITRPDNDTRQNLLLARAPVKAGTRIYEALESVRAAVFTSATLAASGTDPFGYFLREAGLPAKEVKTLQLRSPFDYENRCLLYLPKSMPEPADDERYPIAVAEEIQELLRMTGGGAFLLFTSIRSLTAVGKLIAPFCEAEGIELLNQHVQGSAHALTRFHASRRPALLGLATFWQGIDVPGDALRLVVLVRIPFRVPDDPVLETRTELEEKSGGRPFFSLQLPHAVISIKQGFGRLMRSRSDRGVVSILDPRIYTKGYGREILGALPPARVIRSSRELTKAYDELFENADT